MSQIEKKKKDSRFSKWTIKELLQECEAGGLDASDCETKAEIVELLMRTSMNNNPNTVTKKSSTQSIQSSQSNNAPESTQESEQIPNRKTSNAKASTLPSNFNVSNIQTYNQNFPASTTIVLPRFNISTTIPVKSATEKTFIAYVVDIIEKDETRTVLKRYRQFEELHESLKKNFPKDMVPKLTAKKLIGNLNPEFVNKRCNKLQTWLNIVAGLPGIFNTEYMKTFLEQVEVPGKEAFARSKSKSFLATGPLPTATTGSSSPGLGGNTSARNLGVLRKATVTNGVTQEDDAAQKIVLEKIKALQSQLDSAPNSKLSIDLSSLDLPTIPNSLFEHKTVASHLINLDLSNNFITSIPVDIGVTFPNLQGLSFRNNGITKLTKYIKNLSTLVTLDLSKNNIKDNPVEGIDGLPNLMHLNLSSNSISTLPPAIIHCKILQILDISYNSISVIPDTFGETLLTLVELNISHNEVEELPTSIGKLQHLKKLDVSHNKLQDLPVSLLECSSLRNGIVIVEGNPINEQLLIKARAGASQLFGYLEHCLEGWKGKSKLDFSRLSIAEPPPLERNWNQVFQPKTAPDGSSSTVGEQIIVIQQWAVSEIEEAFIPKLSIMKQKLEVSTSLEEAKSYAQLVRELKRIINEASEHNFWIRVNKALSKLSETEKPPEEVPIMKGGDPLVTLKTVTSHVVLQVIVVLKCVLQVLHVSTLPQEIIRIVRVVQQMNKIFQDGPAL